MLTASNSTARGFRLTGGYVLFGIIAFFATVFAANGALVYYALGSFPGAVTDSAYVASQTYNLEIHAAAAQAARGWNVTTSARRDADGRVLIAVNARDAEGRPLSGVSFQAKLERPTHRAEDVSVPLLTAAGQIGTFIGTADGVAPGQWEFLVQATATDPKAAGERLFLSHERLLIP
jgi:nitrogen fixation protein FixH